MAAQPSGAQRCPPEGEETNWLRLVRLPKPTLTFEPSGPALVGKKVYVMISGTDPVEVNTAEVAISAKPIKYRIDWGDGTATETTHEGEGYPIGPDSNTHIYQETGEETITVTAVWEVSARPGGQLQQLELATTSAAGVTVTQRQAVRTF
jgi:hypothetical protein